jgi:hypothetical protein
LPTKNLPNVEHVSKAVHVALRKWANADDLELKPLKALRIFEGKKTSSVLTSVLVELKITSPMQFEILERRFLLNDAIKRVSFALHISEDHANRQQREGIEALASLLIKKELQARTERGENLLSKLPPRTYERLFGTEEVESKLAALLVKSSSPSILAVTGLGGVGKTALADAVVRAAVEELSYLNLIWVRAESRRGDSINFQDYLLTELAAKLSLQSRPSGYQVDAIKKSLKQEASLIVIDNLEEEVQDISWLYLLHELSGSSKFLLTGRVLPGTLASIQVFKLRELEPRPASEFLIDHTQRLGLADHAQELADRAGEIYALVGGNPLALKLTVGLLHAWPLSTILRSLEEGPGSDVEAMYKHIFEKSWHSISKTAQEMLQAMPLVGEAGGGLDQLQAISGLSELETREALKELTTRSLIELRSATKQPRYGIHRLTESFLRGQLVQTL